MSLINQAGRFLNSRFSQRVQVRRILGGGAKAEYDPEEVTAIVIPTSPNDVLLLPEGERYLPSIKIYTQQPLKIGDLVDYRGQTYKIKTAADWGDYGYYNHIGVRHIPTAKVDSTGFTVT
ncbi:hypothetical protein BKG93_07830 [Rodentibacter ratti]|uniref:Uncharacterized protein n=1 Tax=Rodentibacter ratti TaxID=1906745 RepID=A0A1V3L3P5_9PAST|nr:hypothetical protein [Rodentibacter ratti]OOF84431.1 hypothetical protein BKG93_07830 [Rodentibacter ratti]